MKYAIKRTMWLDCRKPRFWEKKMDAGNFSVISSNMACNKNYLTLLTETKDVIQTIFLSVLKRNML